jgi:uncharacterized damage-inducible protein DinB
MGMSQALLPEFDHEMQNTRKVLERVPEGKPDYRPHPKSMAMARLAAHVAEIPRWAGMTLSTESLDINPPGQPPRTPSMMTSRQELLAGFDRVVAESRAAIAGASDAELVKPWTLLAGGRTVLTMPKAAVLRSFVLSHLIHHRAQLGVYLRLNDVAVPSIYGPSADEGAF